MKRFTVQELANALGIEKDAAYNLVSYMEAREHIETDGKKKNEPGVRGRGQTYFKVKGHLDLASVMAADLQKVLDAPEPVVAPVETKAAPATTPPRGKTPTIPPGMVAELTANAKHNHEEAAKLRAQSGDDPILRAQAAILDAAGTVTDALLASAQA
jgi:hypothetical protein